MSPRSLWTSSAVSVKSNTWGTLQKVCGVDPERRDAVQEPGGWEEGVLMLFVIHLQGLLRCVKHRHQALFNSWLWEIVYILWGR